MVEGFPIGVACAKGIYEVPFPVVPNVLQKRVR